MVEAAGPEWTVCPVCEKQVAFRTINSHIDSCLSHTQLSQAPASSPAATGHKQPSKEGAKQSSPTSLSSSSSSSTAGRQSLLSSFGKRESPSAASTEDQPPGKRQRVATTPKTHTPSSSRLPQRKQFLRPATSPPPPALPSPLAELMRPSTISDFVGQEQVMGQHSILRTVIESGHVPSLIFWGPPGCGKTTLARIIAQAAREKVGARFVQLSATSSGVSEARDIMRVARNDKTMLKRQTILFIDEIHQFNKHQQDTFLHHVEDGSITLLGATTENPSFRLNSALLSRCRVIVLNKLESEEIETILRRALSRLGATEEREGEGEEEGEGEGKAGGRVELREESSSKEEEERSEEQTENRAESSQLDGDSSRPVVIERDVIPLLAQFCDGDARSALNALQIAVQAAHSHHQEQEQQRGRRPQEDGHSTEGAEREVSKEGATSPSEQYCPRVTVAVAKESLQRTHLLYDRAGEEHYNCISALHKSMRGSDPSASLYWLARMLCAGEDPLYIARRVIRFASEDIGMSDSSALVQAVAAYQACQFMGKPECEVVLAQAVVYMARAPKSAEVYFAYGKARSCVLEHKGPLPSVPLHLRNAPTKLMRELGYGEGYKYNPAFSSPVDQEYFPAGLEGTDFFSFD